MPIFLRAMTNFNRDNNNDDTADIEAKKSPAKSEAWKLDLLSKQLPTCDFA